MGQEWARIIYMGQKSPKGSVGITNADGRIRLRWKYQYKRYSMSLLAYSKTNLLQARKLALQIEQDMITDVFDTTLVKYSGKNTQSPSSPSKSFVTLFEQWVSSYKQMDCEIHTNYNSTRNMIKKWGIVKPENILIKINAETFCPGTYNRRLTILKGFVNWLVQQAIWKQNPLLSVQAKKFRKIKQLKREPFTESEIKQILDAFKNDTFWSQYSFHKHSHYYPFIYFLFKTGVRNAEAIGLRVGSINLVQQVIEIKEVLARSLKSTSSVNRVRKETKNGKERLLPLTADLLQVLQSLLNGKGKDDLVFLSPTGKAIDDKNFQNRIFKKVLKELKIPERVLYACRHTFGSRCIDQGITPVMTAFLMGNNPETALRNYTHQINLPKDLPEI